MFSFLWKKAIFAVVPLILAGLLFASCEQPPGTLPNDFYPDNTGTVTVPTVNAQQPTIGTQPAATTNWNVGTTDSVNLTVAATSPDGGSITYQWYSNSSASNSGGSIMDGKTDATLTLNKTNYTANIDHYFYVVVRNTNNSVNGTKTASITSSVATVTVSGNTVPTVNAAQPSITTQPTATTNWDVSSTTSTNLAVAATSPDSGTLGYQWYKNTSNSTTGGTAITTGGTGATLTLNRADYTTNTAYYFYAVVTNTIRDNGDGGNKIATATSNVATVTVTGNTVPTVNAAQPSITTQPVSTTWNTGNTINLTVAATNPDGGTLSYQWYRNTSNSTTGGTAVGTNNVTLTLNKTDYTVAGSYYFYVIITNTITNNGDGGTKTATRASTVATVTVPTVNAQQPTIGTNPTATTNWNVSSTASVTLTVAATSPDGGSITYQWYSNTSNSNSGGSVMTGKTTATLSLAKADYLANGTYYFYAVATNTNNSVNGTKTATRASNVATVTITGNTGFVIYTPTDMAKIGTGTDGWNMTATYVLANDITLTNFTPRGTDAAPFRGTFNGNGKTITVASFASAAVTANRDIGIFGSVKGASASSKAAIRNLKVQSSVSVTGTASNLFQNVGLVAGYAEYAEIDTITLSGSFSYTSDGRIYLGGIVGTINQAGTVVKNSTSSMTMNISPAGSGTGTPVNVNYHYVGGFVGLFANGAGIESCRNSGNFTVDNISKTGGQTFAGGITGGGPYAMSANYHGYVQDSSSTGNITVKNTGLWTFAGGIAGTIAGGTVDNVNTTTRIVRCFATGIVSCEGTSAGNPYIGGIVGYNYYGALVSQCYFTGTVIATKTGDYTGGIAGYNSQTTAPNNSRVEDCWSSGEVQGFNNAGGIVGQNQTNAYIRRCYSTAKVSGTNSASTGVGGITGLNTGTITDQVTACVALNSSVTTPTGNNIHRITGTTGGTRSKNYAWSGMTIQTGGTYTPEIGATLAGGESQSAQKPAQTFYQSTLGWTFGSGGWKWDSASGYPILYWQ